MSSYELRLNDLKSRLESSKNKKIKAETKLEQLMVQKNEIVKELELMGITPEKLDFEIAKLEADIEKLLSEADKMVPKDI